MSIPVPSGPFYYPAPMYPMQYAQGGHPGHMHAQPGMMHPHAIHLAAPPHAMGIPQAVPQPPIVAPPVAAPASAASTENAAKLHGLLQQLLIADQRDTVLFELSKSRDSYPELAPAVWYSVGTLAVLLQEIISVYPALSPPTLQTQPSNRVCNALALLQIVAQHPDTRTPFLQAQIPLFLYPFLNTSCPDKPFEYLRLTSLGVIGALVKSDDENVITFLLQTEIVPLCLKIMEKGTELSKTVATFVVQKVLTFDIGLQYICATPERFATVASVLRGMVATEQCTSRLLRHIIRCYLRLAEHPRARDALRQCLPENLRNNAFQTIYQEDQSINKLRQQLLTAINPEQGS